MPSKTAIVVKDRVMNDEIDLSMSDLTEVPVKEIAQLKKALGLDLSNNHIVTLPKTFAESLSHLTKLDLSRNGLQELPEDIGALKRLRYLDLYQNRLEHLPLSVSELKQLRFLDLKDNPLAPAVAKVAGQCLDTEACRRCARDVVLFYSRLREQVDAERMRRQHHREVQPKKATKSKNPPEKQSIENKKSDEEVTPVAGEILNVGSDVVGGSCTTQGVKSGWMGALCKTTLLCSVAAVVVGVIFLDGDELLGPYLQPLKSCFIDLYKWGLGFLNNTPS